MTVNDTWGSRVLPSHATGVTFHSIRAIATYSVLECVSVCELQDPGYKLVWKIKDWKLHLGVSCRESFDDSGNFESQSHVFAVWMKLQQLSLEAEVYLRSVHHSSFIAKSLPLILACLPRVIVAERAFL
jgi:hypothetical protein